MNWLERFRLDLLQMLKRVPEPHISAQEYAEKYHQDARMIREALIEFAEQGLITLEAWDINENLARPMGEWEDPHDMFFNRSEQGRVRTRLTARGSAVLEELESVSKKPIGFGASAE